MKAFICLLSALSLVLVQPGLAAEPAPAAAQTLAPSDNPELAKLRDALKKLEADPGSAPDLFLDIYRLFSEAEQSADAHDVETAKRRYEAVLAGLQELRKRVPDWNPTIVEFRMKRTKERLAALEPKPQEGEVAIQPKEEPVQKYTPVPEEPAPALKAPPGFMEENRQRAEARKWVERQFNGEKLYVVPLMLRVDPVAR